MRRFLASTGKYMGAQISVWLNVLLGSRAMGGFGILMYHRIASTPRGVEPPTRNVTPTRFRQQMQGLLDRGYQIWPLQAVINCWMNGKPIPSKTAVITFDDGYQNVYLNAWPVLREFGIPATIFVATAYLDSTRPFPFDEWAVTYYERTPSEAWQPLTWAQSLEMERSGLIEIGTHSHTHRDFRGKPGELKQDLLTSLAVLKQQLSCRSFAFAFPYGSRRLGYADQSLVDVAKEVGVVCALTTEIELVKVGSSPFAWGRIEVVESDTGSTLKAKLEGWYNWMGFAREYFRVMFPPPDPQSDR